jgi:predicted ABC-type ATPase
VPLFYRVFSLWADAVWLAFSETIRRQRQSGGRPPPQRLNHESHLHAETPEHVDQRLNAKEMQPASQEVADARLTHLQQLRELRLPEASHYVVLLVFIGMDTGELAIARVVERVDAGGHDVPDDKILSRFPRTLQNLTQVLEFVDHAFLFDNSSAKEPFRFVAEFSNSALVRRGKRRPKWAVSLLKTFLKER